MAKKRRKSGTLKGGATSGDGALGVVLTTSLLAAAALAAAFALVWYQVILQPNQGAESLKREELLSQYTEVLNGRIAELRKQVDIMATAPSTIDAITDPNLAVREQLEKTLAEQVPYIARVKFITRGEGQVELSANVPIPFSALDMIRRAESQPFVGPEISKTYEDFVYAAQPLTPDGMVTGVMLVVFHDDFFDEPAAHLNTTHGTFTVQQTVSASQNAEVLSWGNGGTEALAIEAQLLAGHWSLRFQPRTDLLPDKVGLGNLLIPFLVAVALVIVVIAAMIFMYGARIRKDADTLSEIVVRAVRGRSIRIAGFKIGALENVAMALEPYVKTGGLQQSAEPDDEDEDDEQDDDAAIEPTLGNKKEESSISDDEFLEVTNVGNTDNFGIEVSEEVGPAAMGLEFDHEIFRAYDIRGITTQNLTEDVVYWIGRAFGAEALEHGQTRVAVGWDGRHSSEPLRESLTRGLSEEGMQVITIGQVPTPLLYYATHALDTGTGIMITGSHNPPEYNGLKMMIGGVTLAEERIQRLYERLQNNELSEDATPGEVEEVDLNDSYIDKILEDIAIAQPPKVVVDCGNGVAGNIAPRLLEELGCEVIPLYCDVDGDFPNHHPDPAEPENLEDLITVVNAEGADLGLAFDGDGDRVGVVTASGEIIWPDKLIMLFAQDIVSRNPGADIIYDVKCSRHLNTLISDLGGRPIMWKTGHSHIKAKIKETGALLGGEFSGHICFGERWYGFDDALYSAARLLEIVGSAGDTVDNLFSQFPVTFTTPEIKIQTTESEKFEIMGRLEVDGSWEGGALTTIDGIRVDFDDGWGLIRPSNTSPVLSLRFEADGPAALERIQDLFAAQLSAIDPNLSFR